LIQKLKQIQNFRTTKTKKLNKHSFRLSAGSKTKSNNYFSQEGTIFVYGLKKVETWTFIFVVLRMKKREEEMKNRSNTSTSL